MKFIVSFLTLFALVGHAQAITHTYSMDQALVEKLISMGYESAGFKAHCRWDIGGPFKEREQNAKVALSTTMTIESADCYKPAGIRRYRYWKSELFFFKAITGESFLCGVFPRSANIAVLGCSSQESLSFEVINKEKEARLKADAEAKKNAAEAATKAAADKLAKEEKDKIDAAVAAAVAGYIENNPSR